MRHILTCPMGCQPGRKRQGVSSSTLEYFVKSTQFSRCGHQPRCDEPSPCIGKPGAPRRPVYGTLYKHLIVPQLTRTIDYAKYDRFPVASPALPPWVSSDLSKPGSTYSGGYFFAESTGPPYHSEIVPSLPVLRASLSSSAKSLSENCHEWFDKLPTNGQSSVRPFRLLEMYIAGLRRCGEHCRGTVKHQIKVFG